MGNHGDPSFIMRRETAISNVIFSPTVCDVLAEGGCLKIDFALAEDAQDVMCPARFDGSFFKQKKERKRERKRQRVFVPPPGSIGAEDARNANFKRCTHRVKASKQNS